ncbi:MAG TPA: Hpt domain-containing protein [Campylobacterales bacterium]|nr:Hpt domain-containing protein [Campylobacterales bacterium]
MNMKLLAELLEFDLEDVEMLVDMFLTDTKESLENIESTIESNDFEQMKNIAHGIKGSALNLMLSEIAEVALEIEQSAKTKSSIDYHTLFQKLEFELSIIADIKAEV